MWTRGLERRTIFYEDADRHDLLQRLGAVLPRAGMRCFAWALLSNHFHLVLQTGETPLSIVLKRVATGFAVSFNRRHERVGYVFQSRFGSRLVTANDDLMALVRYVHLNPVRAGLVSEADLARYPWCGHSALVGERQPLPFESLSEVLALFDADPVRARERIRAFVGEPDTVFYESPRSDGSVDESDLEALVRSVCARTGVPAAAVRRGSRHRAVSRARAIVCYLAVGELGISGRTAARFLGITPGGVSQLLRRGEALVRDGQSRWHPLPRRLPKLNA